MEIADVVHNIKAEELRIKHSNVTITQLSRDETIEAIQYMIATIEEEPALVTDSGGELNSTQLTELTCEINDLYLDDEIPEDLFEIAHAVCKQHEIDMGVQQDDN